MVALRAPMRPVGRVASEADVRKLHEQLEYARRNYRPENGFLLDAPQPRLPGRRRK